MAGGRTNGGASKATHAERMLARQVGLQFAPGTRTVPAGRRRGAPLDQLQKAAGHKDPRSTEIYAELEQERATRVLRFAREPRSSRDG